MPKEGPGPLDVMIGAHLRYLRLKAGLSAGQVALALDVSQQLVDKQERGGSRVSVAQLRRLAAFYGRTLAQLMTEMALDRPASQWVGEPEAAPYVAGPTPRPDTEGGFAREPFLINLSQLHDPSERMTVLDLFNRLKQMQNR